MAVMQVSTQWVNSAVQGIKDLFKEKRETGGEQEYIRRLTMSVPADRHSIELFERKAKTYQDAARDEKVPENERRLNGLRAEAYSEGLKILTERQAQAAGPKK